jgi:hypothetical protein
VEAAGDVYAADLKMGTRSAYFDGLTHHLSGHWKDELLYLEDGLNKLEQERADFKPPADATTALPYKVATAADNAHLFQVRLQQIETAPAQRPLKIRAKVTARAGVKWVRLRYRSVNQKEEYASLPMIPAAEKDWYEATVPPNDLKPEFDFMYLVEVMDQNNKGKMYPDFNIETPYVVVKLIR